MGHILEHFMAKYVIILQFQDFGYVCPHIADHKSQLCVPS